MNNKGFIIAVTGGKGGTGKSTVATSLAVEYAKSMKTMLVDADAECPNDYLIISAKLKKYSEVFQSIPKFDLNKCIKCGKCALACNKNAIVFVKGKYPAFIKDVCVGCKACIPACPVGAITESSKVIGTISTGKNYNINLVSSELKLGELASGEVVAEVRKKAEELSLELKPEITIIDSSAGIGCPVIASLVGTDYIVAVTEPTPSALHDLKRVLYLANHFKIKSGIVINKWDLDENFYKKIELFAKNKKLPIIGKIPYNKEFVYSNIKMIPITETNIDYKNIFTDIISKIR